MTRIHGDPWIVRTYGGDHENVLVLAGPSANEELTVRAVIPTEFDGRYEPGQKNPVRSIKYSSPEAGVYEFTVITNKGQTVTLQADRLDQIVAGSSVNIAIGLQKLGGVEDVAVFGPIGGGRGGGFISSTLQERGFKLALFRSESGTARTLTVRSPKGGKSTLFLEKPGCVAPIEVVDYLTNRVKPDLFFATGVKPDDLELIEAMLNQEIGIFRILTPNKEVLAPAHLERFRCLVRKAGLFILNHVEAGRFLGEDFKLETAEAQIRKMAEAGAEVTGVTMGEHGAVLMEKGKSPIFQEACAVDEKKDDCGTGDALCAAVSYLLFIHSPRPSLAECLKMGTWVASQKLRHDGPWSGVPGRAEFKQKMAEWGIR